MSTDMPSTLDTSSVNPLIKKARWIAVKLKTEGLKALNAEEKVFIAQLSYRAAVQNDRTAMQLVTNIQTAHLEFQLTLHSAK
jgi:hypothetical protein